MVCQQTQFLSTAIHGNEMKRMELKMKRMELKLRLLSFSSIHILVSTHILVSVS